mmetsp:Transcript_35944/g.103282  ORF Transcript_35944/g.103282 Transcript_35944/m.103282 type:complete len:203 (+) Transcript_35944:1222-1830(+)
MSDRLVDVGVLEFSRNVLEDPAQPGEYFYELNALVPDRPKKRIYLPLDICRTSVNFYTKDRNGRESLLPKGVLPNETVGLTNGNGATLRRQEVSSPTTASGQGGGGDVFIRLPSGVFYQVVRPGSGPKPTRDQHVKIDVIEWRDDFDGQRKKYDLGGLEGRVSWQQEWLQEVFTDMRVGEVRRVILPTVERRYVEYRLVSIL